MANEISIAASLSASKGGADVSTSISGSLDMSGEDMVDVTQTVSTGATALNLGSIAGLPAYVLVKNMDTTNFITLSAESNFNANSTVFCKLLPGQFAMLPPATALFAKADTANCKLIVTAVEA